MPECVSGYLDPLIFGDSRLNNVFARTSWKANRIGRFLRSGVEKRLNLASRLKIQIVWMLSIRELICSPDCGIKIDMRDRSVWRRGPPRFLLSPTVMSVEELQRRLAPSKAAAPASRNVKEIPQPAACPYFFTSYIYAIFISAKFSVRKPSVIISTQQSRRRNFSVGLNLAERKSHDR